MTVNHSSRKATASTPEEVRNRITMEITSYCHRHGLGYETIPHELGPVSDAVLAIHTALTRDTRVVRITTFYDDTTTALPRQRVLVTLQSWYVRDDKTTYDHKTTTASERSVIQKMCNLIHDELNAWADQLGVTK